MKAHQLCVVLQEKNDGKAREVALRVELEALTGRFGALTARHQTLVDASAAGNAAGPAQQEQWTIREERLQQALLDARAEVLRLQVASTEPRSHPAHGGVEDPSSTLAKQNALLKARVAKLKEQLSAATAETVDKAEGMQRHVDELLAQVAALQQHCGRAERLTADEADARNDVTMELVQQRAAEDILRRTVAALEAEVRQWRDMDAARGDGVPTDHRAKVAAEAKAEALAAELETKAEELWASRADAQQKAIELTSLAAQMASLRGRIESFEAEREQREVQGGMLAGVEERLLAAVGDVASSQTTSVLSQKMLGINEQLRQLETLELQLRQKEDLLAVAEDDAAMMRQQHDALQESLAAVSTMFLQLPRTVASLERLVIERDEYRGEVLRCAERRGLPDAVETDGRVELRVLEAETQRQGKRELAAVGDGLPAAADEMLLSVGEALDDFIGGDGDGDGAADEGFYPVLPPLVDITAALTDEQAVQQLVALSPRHAGAAAAAGGAAAVPVSDEDVRLTFQLFDEQDAGVLPVEVVRLCLTTLGLRTSLVPLRTVTMTSAEFLALCVQQSDADAADASCRAICTLLESHTICLLTLPRPPVVRLTAPRLLPPPQSH
jgi:hypothetical protein